MWSGPVGLGAMRTRSMVIGSLYERARVCLATVARGSVLPALASRLGVPSRRPVSVSRLWGFSWGVHVRRVDPVPSSNVQGILVGRAPDAGNDLSGPGHPQNPSDVHVGRESRPNSPGARAVHPRRSALQPRTASGTRWKRPGSASPSRTRTRAAGRRPSVARPRGPSRVSESSDSERARMVMWAPGVRARASR
jgi:hypothetical protein